MPPQVPVKSRQVMAQKILQQSREAESALADALVSLPPGGVLVSICSWKVLVLTAVFVRIMVMILGFYDMYIDCSVVYYDYLVQGVEFDGNNYVCLIT